MYYYCHSYLALASVSLSHKHTALRASPHCAQQSNMYWHLPPEASELQSDPFLDYGYILHDVIRLLLVAKSTFHNPNYTCCQ